MACPPSPVLGTTGPSRAPAKAAEEEGLRSERRVYTEAQKERAAADQKFAMDSGAVALSGDSYDGFMAAHSLVLVMYYAPWCYWSRAAFAELDAAAKLLSHHEPPVIAAKIDCTEHEDTCNNEFIQAYPTIRLYIDGVAQLYEGRRERTNLVHWVDLRVDRDKQLVSTAHLDELINSSRRGEGEDGHVVVVAAFPPDYNKGGFQSVARAFGEEVFFGDTANPDVIKHLIDAHVLPGLPAAERRGKAALKELVPPFVVVFVPHKDETAAHIYRGSVGEVNELRLFVRQWLFPVVSLFDMETIGNTFFKDLRPKLLLLLDSQEHGVLLKQATASRPKDPLLAAFRAQAEAHRANVVAAVSGNTTRFEKQLLSLLGIEEESLPQVRLLYVSPKSEGPHHPTQKYKPSPSLPFPAPGSDKSSGSQEAFSRALDGFIKAVLTHQLAPYFRSEAPPEVPEPKGRVRTLVASTFASDVRQEANVLVEFYAPWCGFCRKMEPAYKELAARVADVPGLIIARIDATRNEVDGVAISGYPTLYLYRTGEQEPLLYIGDRTTADMLQWLHSRVRGIPSFDPLALMAKDLGGSNGGKGPASALEEL
ncbi:protein disulfide-isomerase A4 [Cyclospora cayetanensis]|uniref:protein disulfide-isomerase n=1 Tax=Cyclospora cayetanensis TaxID=88456 RepID=A0A6P6RUB7_9EIME|nr:protein disulfide-isomerase A4 [Cyclospora cayetanensis]